METSSQSHFLLGILAMLGLLSVLTQSSEILSAIHDGLLFLLGPL